LGGVVLEHGGHVVRGELLRGVRDEKRSLTDSAITDYIATIEEPKFRIAHGITINQKWRVKYRLQA
jgi:hypothetical protein